MDQLPRHFLIRSSVQVHTDTHFTDRIALGHGNVGDDVGNHRVDRDAIGYLRSLKRNSIYSNLSGGGETGTVRTAVRIPLTLFVNYDFTLIKI